MSDHSKRIAEINDAFRKGQGCSGRWLITSGVTARGSLFVDKALAAVALFDAFTSNNDPYGEHDFGSIEIDDETLFWKIDYYQTSSGYSAGAENPEDTAKTDRVLTVTLAEEY